MVTLFDQEKVMEIHNNHVAEATRKDGLQEGRFEGRTEGITSILQFNENLGMTIEQELAAVDLPEAEYAKYVSLLQKQ